MYKIIKYQNPNPLYKLFNFTGNRNSNILITPKVKLDVLKNNFVFQSSTIWNIVISKVFNPVDLNDNDIIIPGSCINSDFCTTIGFFKYKIRQILYDLQNRGDVICWDSMNRNFEIKYLGGPSWTWGVDTVNQSHKSNKSK